MPYCANCGTEVEYEARFCSECGYLLNSRNQAASNDLDGIKGSPSGFEQHKTDQDYLNEGKKHLTSRATKKTPRARPQEKAIILPLLLIVVMLALGTIIFILTGEETYSASGRVVNYAGEGITGVTIDFGEDFGTAKTDEKGYWTKSDLQGEITVTPQYGNVLFNPIRSEISKAEDEVNFALLKEVDKGITSSAGEYVFSSNLTVAEEVEITVLVEDLKTGEQLEGIAVEVVVSGDIIEIFLQDNSGEYLPEIIVLEMEHLDSYPGIEVRRGSILLLIRVALLAKPYLEWAIENPREASAVTALGVAVAMDVYGLASYAAGGIAITTGAGALPGVGVIATGFATTIASELLKVYAESVFAGKKQVEQSLTVYIFESRDRAQYTKIAVSAGVTTDEIVEAIEYIVGRREFSIEIPEKNPAGVYYNDDNTPKFINVYLKDPGQELEVENEDLLEEIYVVDVKDGNNLYLRITPGTKNKTNDDIIDRMPKGSLIEVINRHDDNVVIDEFTWWEVRNLRTGISGWAASEYLIESKAEENNKDPEHVNDSKQETTADRRGNTVGNVVNWGLAAQQGDWIYYRNLNNESRVYKILTDGSERTQINNDYSMNINVLGDWIYYSNRDENGIFKIRTDGKERTRINDDPSGDISVVGNWIYYINFNDGSKIYKIRTDGKERTRINDDPSSSINVVGDWIYYTNYDDETRIYKVRTNGKERSRINDDPSGYINVVGDWIYYTNLDYNKPNDEGRIFKVSIDGRERTRINDVSSAHINVVGDWIYYVNVDDQESIYKVRTDGKDSVCLSSHEHESVRTGVSWCINVAGGWIYYLEVIPTGIYEDEDTAFEDIATMYVMRIDGTDLQKVD